jgi:hypothetical protein
MLSVNNIMMAGVALAVVMLGFYFERDVRRLWRRVRKRGRSQRR